jgi:hypothetical protein
VVWHWVVFRGRNKTQKIDILSYVTFYLAGSMIDYDYKVSQKVLVWKESILHKSESIWHRKPWLITSVHTNGTIMVQCGNKLERMKIRRVKLFVENLDNE